MCCCYLLLFRYTLVPKTTFFADSISTPGMVTFTKPVVSTCAFYCVSLPICAECTLLPQHLGRVHFK